MIFCTFWCLLLFSIEKNEVDKKSTKSFLMSWNFFDELWSQIPTRIDCLWIKTYQTNLRLIKHNKKSQLFNHRYLEGFFLGIFWALIPKELFEKKSFKLISRLISINLYKEITQRPRANFLNCIANWSAVDLFPW